MNGQEYAALQRRKTFQDMLRIIEELERRDFKLCPQAIALSKGYTIKIEIGRRPCSPDSLL
jgi:hypothetical protein